MTWQLNCFLWDFIVKNCMMHPYNDTSRLPCVRHPFMLHCSMYYGSSRWSFAGYLFYLDMVRHSRIANGLINSLKPTGAIFTSELLFRVDIRGIVLNLLSFLFTVILQLFLMAIFSLSLFTSPPLRPAVNEVGVSCLIVIMCHMFCFVFSFVCLRWS